MKSSLYLYRKVRKAPRSKNNLYPKNGILSLPPSFIGKKVKIELVKVRRRKSVRRTW